MNLLISKIFILILAQGQAQALPPLTLDQAIEKARAYSPEIRSFKNQVASAEAKASLAIAPYEPLFTVQYNDMPASPFDLGNPTSTVYQVQQQIGFPGRAFVNHASLKNQAHAVEAQMHATELQIVANTRAAYNGLVLAKETANVNQEQRYAYERILEIAKRRYESGAIPQVDLLNAQITLYSNINDVGDAVAASRSAQAQLNVLMGEPTDRDYKVDPIKPAKLVIPSLEKAQSRMLEGRNEIKAARFQFKASSDSYRLAQMSLLPDLQITAGTSKYLKAGACPLSTVRPDISQTYLIGVQIMIPIWGLFNERRAITGAARDRAAADANLQTTLNQSLISLKSTLETLGALQIRLANYEQHLLPLSEQALSLAMISYSAGKIDFQTLADTANSRRNTRRDYLTALVNYTTNESALGQLLGEEL